MTVIVLLADGKIKQKSYHSSPIISNLERDPRGFRLSLTISFLVRETKDGLVNTELWTKSF